MQQIVLDTLIDRGWIEMHDRSFRAGNFDPDYCSKPAAVIETGAMGEVIKRLTIDPLADRRVFQPARDRARLGFRAQAPDSVGGQRVPGQPRGARPVPGPP